MSKKQGAPNDYVKIGKVRKQYLATMDVFTAARDRFRYLYANFDTVIISWSGGKDSTICLELAREAAREAGRLPVKVMFLDEEVILPETLEIAYRAKADPEIDLYWVCVPSVYRNACSESEPNFIPFDPAARDVWTHVPPEDAIWPAGFDENGLPNMTTWRVPPSIPKRIIYELWGKQPELYGRIVNVSGLRAHESPVRQWGIMSSAGFITKPDKGVYSARPVYDWLASDVWLAIKENGWDYNRAYDKLWRAGRHSGNARIAPLFHAESAMELGSIMRGWPHFWPLIRRRIRGAHAVAIYGGQLHKVERLPGETWKDAATRYLNALGDEADRKQMYSYVNSVLDIHGRKSTVEMSDDKKCACCGVSWKEIARACARGDRQQRMLRKYSK